MARFCRCSISARASGLVNTRAGSVKVAGLLRAVWPAPSVASSAIVTFRPA